MQKLLYKQISKNERKRNRATYSNLTELIGVNISFIRLF